jgi:pimeloyl-ACP methyl ester carboxylesterase
LTFVRLALEQPVHSAALGYFNAHEFLTFDLRPALARVTAPTLVVAGQEDFILGPPACREVAEGITSARLEVLQDVGHIPWVESPEKFAATVRTFLDD